MAEISAAELLEATRTILEERWPLIPGLQKPAQIPTPILEAVERSINSKTITYRYVLPTQILAKAAYSELDCRAVQAGCGLEGAFDARSICHKAVVPFERLNQSVLGGSSEPYLNNPLRIPAILEANLKSQKDKNGFNDLLLVLDYAQSNSKQIPALLDVILVEIYRRMQVVTIVYPVPNRCSQSECIIAIQHFLEHKSGGLRLQIVATSIFRTLGAITGLYTQVEANHINAADVGTGHAADLECRNSEGQCVLAVEVKDRELTLRQVQDKLPGIRETGIRELLFLVRGEHVVPEEIHSLIHKEFTSGQNIYVIGFQSFLECCTILFGESGRRTLMVEIGKELDAQRADYEHRKNWSELISDI